MHRVLRIAALVFAGAVLIVAGITGYAAYNLNAFITRHQDRLLQRVSRSLGRNVQVSHIKTAIGWGLSIEADDLKIADDPAFSRDPFLTAAQASFDVKLLPLLRGDVKVHRLELSKPAIRILRQPNGRLNVDTLAQGAAREANIPSHSHGANALHGVVWMVARDVSIKGLAIDDGTVYYSDPALKGVPLQLNHLSVEMAGFHTGSPFDVNINAALFNDQPNFELSGKMGPVLRRGTVDIPDCPLDLSFKTGPVTIDNLRTLLAPGRILPVTISMPAPLIATGTIKGSLENVALAASSDFSDYRIIYRAPASKPGAAPLTLDLSGSSAVNGALRPLEAGPGWNITATLTKVASRFEGAQLPAVVGLNGRLHLTPSRLELEPTTFTLGSGQASLQASADSISPLRSAFTFKADSLQLSQIVPSRPPGEFVRQLVVTGTAGGELSAPVIKSHITSAGGLVERLAYSKLNTNTTYAGNQLSAQPLSVDVFSGSVLANVNVILASRPPFDASANLRHIDVSQVFRWLDIRSSAISGYATIDARVAGAGASWKEIGPTLRSNGHLYLSGGELHGVNIVAIALNKIAVAPVVSELVGVAFRSSHQQVFADSNTDLQQASMTFNLYGQRINTNDLVIQSPDYGITGAGWFDMDKNINMSGDIKLTLGLSAAIPVVVMGKYPALLVLPDIPKLAERTALGVVNAPVNIIKNGVNGLNSVFGGIRSILP